MELENNSIENLIVDSAAFIKRVNLRNLAKNFYTIPEILHEQRDKLTREYISNLPYEVIIQQPTQKSLQIVMNVAKKTGDYMSLSLADLKIIALTHDFQLEKCGPESINYESKVGPQKINDNKERVETLPKGFYNPKITNNKDDDSEDEWIDSYNVNSILKNTDSKLVACFSADFSVQNVLKHMGINIMSLDGRIITQIQTYIFRCRSCFSTTSIMTKEFCPKCGNKTLNRVPITVNENGEVQLNLNMEKLRVTRGFRHSTTLPKGGKHDIIEKCFEDQRIPQNRMARIKKDTLDSPFTLNDVTSRSALLGVRSMGRTARTRNPNETIGRAKKGGKK